MADLLKVRVVSPVETVFDGTCTSMVVPGWDGRIGILPGHAPMIALLGGGSLELGLAGGETTHWFVNRGVVKVEGNEVVLLSEYAATEAPADFDPAEAWLDESDPEELGYPGNPLV